MRVVIQRVTEASVSVGGRVVGRIGQGFAVLIGVSRRDTLQEARWLADKVAGLRIFSDANGKMSLALSDVDGSVLVISQFTLYGDVRRGLRPDFGEAGPPEAAVLLYRAFAERLRERGLFVETGEFGAHMEVQLTNSGPVTIIIDTDEVMPNGLRRISDSTRDA